MIKNLIFDFGGVLLPISELKARKAFSELGAKESMIEDQTVLHQYEKGEISTKKFEKTIQAHLFRKVFLDDIGVAWNALIDSEISSETISFLKSLKGKYRIFLLSNTNELHINAIKESSGIFTYSNFLRQFEKTYYSYEIGMRKPDAEIFEKVLQENDLEADETFYIDDAKQHVSSAEKLGIHTWHFEPELDDISDLDKVLSKHHS